MDDNDIHDSPLVVEALQGTVVVKIPDGAEFRFTPGAAEETSDRLLEGAMKARGQTYFTDDQRD